MGMISKIYTFGDDPAKAAASREWQAARAAKKANRKKKAKRVLVRRTAPAVYTRYGEVLDYRPGMIGHEFYRTRAWLELRYKVLERDGAKCRCCGLSRRDGAIIHVDHIKPRSVYPKLELDAGNCQVLCELCNIGKSNKSETNWNKPGP